MPSNEPTVRRIDAAGEADIVEREVLDAALPHPSESRGTRGHDLAQASARRARMVRMKLGGMTYQQIADEEGYQDASHVRHLVIKALDRVEARNVQEYRDVQYARLERLHAAIWPLVIGSHRRLREDGTEDPSYVDPDTRIKAAGMILRNAERQAKLVGADAPQRLDVSAGAQAQLEDALLELRKVVLGTVLDVNDTTDSTDRPGETG